MFEESTGRGPIRTVHQIVMAFGLGIAGLACGTSSEPSMFGVGDASADATFGNDGPSGSPDGGAPGFSQGDASRDDGGTVCRTCADLGYTCGQNGDGCGHPLDCGTCAAPEYCGGAGFSKCGSGATTLPDGAPVCTPKTCAGLGYDCGPAGDGCGNELQCGTCGAPAFCGGGGFAKCGTLGGGADGGSSSCVPSTCVSLGYNCGAAGDGCGGALSCGKTCPAGQFCGGGGFNKCGSGVPADGGSACVPMTCSKLGYTCGAAADGCGGLLNCGVTCPTGLYCGGGGYDVCGPSSTGTCPGGGSTSISGYVYDPGNNVPVYNALVYIPVGKVTLPQTGVNPASPSCSCDAPPAYASAFTGIDGSFTLSNIPASLGNSVTIVVQLGKWQRVFPETVTKCANTALATHLTLPSTHLQGNIPLFAVDTGNVDAMECVLLKMGIAPSEFVDPAITGGVPTAPQRIHVYQGSIVKGGAIINAQTPTEDALTEHASVMDSYDAILFSCQGAPATYNCTTSNRHTTCQVGYNAANNFPGTWNNLLNFTAAGGRAFTTHFHYDLLDGNGSFSGTAQWALNTGSWDTPPYSGYIDQAFARGSALAQWLNQPVVYGGTLGQIPVSYIRNDFSAVNPPAQLWMSMDNAPGTFPVHYTFDTPFGASPTCGRVVYSDFHVENIASAYGMTFPNECAGSTDFTPQEKLLEFMLFDLTSCVRPPTCTPLTCADFPTGTCGQQGDGCGGATPNCLTCTPPQTCGGGGVPGQCGGAGTTCMPEKCSQQGIECGPAGDGCGNALDCGTCSAPQTCGGGGMAGKCGGVVACNPETCAQQGIACGPAGDGCGGLLPCGTCTPPQRCGGAGVPGQCGGGGTCTPTTCVKQNISCGPAGDGCGNLLQCGTCTAPATCGGGGVAGQCGSPSMTR